MLIRFKLTRSIARVHLRQLQILVELAYFVEQSNSSRGEYKHVPPIKTSFYAVYTAKKYLKHYLGQQYRHRSRETDSEWEQWRSHTSGVRAYVRKIHNFWYVISHCYRPTHRAAEREWTERNATDWRTPCRKFLATSLSERAREAKQERQSSGGFDVDDDVTRRVLTESFTRAPRRRGVRSDVTSSRPLNHPDTSTHNALSAVSVRHQNDRRIYGNARTKNVPTRSGRIYRPLWYVVLVKQSVHLCSYFLCATYAPFIIMSKWLHGWRSPPPQKNWPVWLRRRCCFPRLLGLIGSGLESVTGRMSPLNTKRSSSCVCLYVRTTLERKDLRPTSIARPTVFCMAVNVVTYVKFEDHER